MEAPQVFEQIEHHFAAGELALAEAEALDSEPLILRSGPDWIERFRLQEAKIRLYQGNTDDALKLLKENGNTPATPAEQTVIRSTLLAMVYARKGDYAGARAALAEAEPRCSDDSSRAHFFTARGILGINEGNLQDAEHAFELALVSAEKAEDRYQQDESLLDLGVVALRVEHYEDAQDRLARASELAKSIGSRIIIEKATGNAAWAFYKLGDFRKALASAQAAEKEAAELGVPIDQVEWLKDAGLNEFHLGDLVAARSYYEKSYETATSIANYEEIVDAQVALGQLSIQTGDLPSALEHTRKAKEVAALHLDETQMFQPALLHAITLTKLKDLDDAKDELLTLHGRAAAKPSDRWKAESALAHLNAEAGNAAEADDWFELAIHTFDLQRSSFRRIKSRLPFLENGTDLYLGYVDQLISEGRTDKALAVLDRSRAETLAEGLGLAQQQTGSLLKTTSLAQRLKGTILVYCLRPETSYLWAISPSKSAFFRLPSTATILPLLESHTNAILHSKDLLADEAAPGRSLYDMLIRPAESLIPDQGKVFVISDEALHGLNFETLISSRERPHFWIEDATITNSASLNLLNAKDHTAPGPRTLLLIGDPAYGSDAPKLANAPHEIANVSNHFAPERRVVLTGSQAFPAAYERSEPARFSFIHFVAHGTASEINPLDSSVVLSPTPGLAETNKLYARDILDHHIGAELVTISACYGSGSRAYSGEGLVGLAWAFLRAGSHNVIASLWEISDASTPELMDHLYDELGSGAAPDVALRSAKLAMLRSEGVFRKPLYWAPFQLYSGA